MRLCRRLRHGVPSLSAVSRLRDARLCVLPREGWLQDASADPEQKTLRERVCGMVSLMTSSRDKHDKLWRAMLILFSLHQPTADFWLHGEVVALDSRPAKESDCGGSHVKRVMTKQRKTQ